MSFQIPNFTVQATGEPVTYFVIASVNFDPIAAGIRVNVNGYLNQAAYAAGLHPIMTQGFMINEAVYAAFLASTTAADIPAGTSQGNVLAELMESLQTNMLSLPFFANATIVA